MGKGITQGIKGQILRCHFSSYFPKKHTYLKGDGSRSLERRLSKAIGRGSSRLNNRSPAEAIENLHKTRSAEIRLPESR
jgi:hypothetical protein